jgi:hypothetical protein
MTQEIGSRLEITATYLAETHPDHSTGNPNLGLANRRQTLSINRAMPGSRRTVIWPRSVARRKATTTTPLEQIQSDQKRRKEEKNTKDQDGLPIHARAGAAEPSTAASTPWTIIRPINPPEKRVHPSQQPVLKPCAAVWQLVSFQDLDPPVSSEKASSARSPDSFVSVRSARQQPSKKKRSI